MKKYHYLKDTMNKYYNTSPRPISPRKSKKTDQISLNKILDEYLLKTLPDKTPKTDKATKKRGRPKGSKNKVKAFVIPEVYSQDNVILAVWPYRPSQRFLYIDWSLNIKAPVTEFMKHREYLDYVAENYFHSKPPVFTVKNKSDIKSILVDNKAGPNETLLSLEEIKTAYGFRQAQKKK